MYTYFPSLLDLPGPPNPSSRSSQSAKLRPHRAPVLYSGFPSATYFTYGDIHVHLPIHFAFLSPLCPHIHSLCLRLYSGSANRFICTAFLDATDMHYYMDFKGAWWETGLPRWLSGKESAHQCRRPRRREFDPWVWKIPWKRNWQPTLVFSPGKSYGHGSLAGQSPWACLTGSGMTEHARIHNMKLSSFGVLTRWKDNKARWCWSW